MLEHLSGVWRYRYFWFSLVKMDLMTRYRKSVLGIGWSLVHPLAMTAVLCVMWGTLLSDGSSNWKIYALQTLAGLTMWEFLKNCMIQGCTSLLRSEAYIRQAPLPYSIYPLRTVLGNSFHFLISLGLLIILAVILIEDGLTASVFMILPLIILSLLFSWALATLTAFATAFFHDITHMVEVGAHLLFFLTPIIYNRKQLDAKNLGWLADINPFSVFIDLLRLPLVDGEIPSWTLYQNAVVFTFVLFGCAIGTVAWLQRKVIFHL